MVSVEPFDLEVISADRTFQNLVLYLLNDDILAVKHLQPVTGAELSAVLVVAVSDGSGLSSIT